VQVLQVFVARMPAEQVKFVSKHSHCVSIARHWGHTTDLRLDPGHGVQVQNINVIETLVAIVAPEHVELAANAGHCVAGSRRWLLARNFGFAPNKTHRVEQVQVVQPLVSVVASVEVNFINVDGGRVIVAACWLLPVGLWFASADELVEVEHVEVIESFLSIPASEDVKIVSDFVTRVCCSATRRIVLRNRRIPGHNVRRYFVYNFKIS